MAELPPEKIKARIAAGMALSASAGRASESFDKMACWFLAGFGAGLALALGGLKAGEHLTNTHAVGSAVYFFIWASGFCLAQRYVGIVVQGGISGMKDGNEIGEKLQPFDIQEFFIQMKAGLPFLSRKIAEGIWNSTLQGDFAANGRLLIRLAILQGLLAIGEIALLLVAMAKFANGLNL